MKATYIGCIRTHAHCVKVTSSSEIASQPIQGFLEAYFKIKQVVGKKKNPYSCEVRIEKSFPRDHRLSSLGKPRDVKRRSWGRIFLSYPHTHEIFLYYNLGPVHKATSSLHISEMIAN